MPPTHDNPGGVPHVAAIWSPRFTSIWSWVTMYRRGCARRGHTPPLPGRHGKVYSGIGAARWATRSSRPTRSQGGNDPSVSSAPESTPRGRGRPAPAPTPLLVLRRPLRARSGLCRSYIPITARRAALRDVAKVGPVPLWLAHANGQTRWLLARAPPQPQGNQPAVCWC
jgi:hypothetical protein